MGRVLWTALTMGVVGLMVVGLGSMFVLHYVGGFGHNDYREQSNALLYVLVLAGVASFGTGVAVWHAYPSMLRRLGIGWGSD